MSEKVVRHFKRVDPVIFGLIGKVEMFEFQITNNYFENLCRAICNQQLSTKSAAAIFKRLKISFLDNVITPEGILKLSDEKLRKVGLSRTKIIYMKDLAQKVIEKEIEFEKFLEMENEEIIEELTRVKGIGVWTVEMFLMGSLGREDVFSYGDLGLRKAIQKLYNFEKLPSQKEMEKIVEKWKPYRTYASKLLWKSLTLTV